MMNYIWRGLVSNETYIEILIEISMCNGIFWTKVKNKKFVLNWSKWVPKKVNIHAWRSEQNHIPTWNAHMKRCNHFIIARALVHIVLFCINALEIYMLVLGASLLYMPSLCVIFFRLVIWSRRLPKKKLFMLLYVLVGIWCLWKLRNAQYATTNDHPWTYYLKTTRAQILMGHKPSSNTFDWLKLGKIGLPLNCNAFSIMFGVVSSSYLLVGFIVNTNPDFPKKKKQHGNTIIG